MENENRFEAVSDYKKTLKTFIKGLIKSKIYVDDEVKLNLKVKNDFCKKSNTGSINVFVQKHIGGGTYFAEFEAFVSRRIYNKVNLEFFDPIIAQFGKLKGFGGITVQYVIGGSSSELNKDEE